MAAQNQDLDFGGRVGLEDAFSGAAKRIAAALRALQGGFEAAAAKITGASTRLARATDRARDAKGRFLATARTTPASLRGVAEAYQATTGAVTRLDRALLAVARRVAFAAVVGGIAALVGLTRRATEASASIENLRLAFTTLLGSTDAANAHLAELQRFAIGKPFQFSDLTETSRQLQTFGFQVGEITGLLTDFGNAAFTANTGMDGVRRMARVFGQMNATNKTTFGQLTMLVRAGVPAFQILRDQLHLTDQQLRNIARSGIPSRTVIDALRRGMQQRFAGGMDRAAQTVTARLSDLQDISEMFLRMIGDELRPTLLGFLNEFGGGLARLDLQVWARRVASVLSTTMRVVRAVGAVIGGAFTDVRERWSTESGRTLDRLMDWLAGVRDVADAASALLGTSDSQGLGRVPRALHDRLVARGLWPVALRIAQWGDRVRVVLGGFLEGLSTELRSLAGAFGMALGPMNLSRAEARQLGQDLAHAAANAVKLRAALLGIQAAVGAGGAIKGLSAFAARNPITAIIMAAGAATVYLARNWDRLTNSTRGTTVGLRAVLQWIAGPLGTAIAMLYAKWGSITGAVRATGRWLGRVWASATAGASTGLASMWGAITGAFRSMGRWLQGVWSGVWNGAVSALARIGAAISRWTAPVRLVLSFLGVALYTGLAWAWLAIADLGRRAWVALSVPMNAAATAIRSALGGAWAWLSANVSAAVSWIGGQLHALGARLATLGMGLRIWASMLRKTIGAAFSALAEAMLSPLRTVAARLSLRLSELGTGLRIWASELRKSLGAAFAALTEAMLAPFRALATRLVALFRALPRNMQPAGMAGMVSALEAFGRDAGNEREGAPPGGSPRPTTTPTPAPNPITTATTQRAVAQARAGNAVAPVVNVHPPPNPPVTVSVRLNEREIARATQRQREDDRLRRGGSGDSEE